MASRGRRRQYTASQVLDLVLNDSDSEGPLDESDSEETLNGSETSSDKCSSSESPGNETSGE